MPARRRSGMRQRFAHGEARGATSGKHTAERSQQHDHHEPQHGRLGRQIEVERGPAPIALRMPISRVRWSTFNVSAEVSPSVATKSTMVEANVSTDKMITR